MRGESGTEARLVVCRYVCVQVVLKGDDWATIQARAEVERKVGEGGAHS